MNYARGISYSVFLALTLGAAAVVLAQDRQAFIERLSTAISQAFNEYDPDRQVRPAALEILNANESLSEALRNSLNEEFEGVPNALDAAQDALREAGEVLLEIAGQEIFLTGASRLQNESFFVVRDVAPETASDALKLLGEACLENADMIENLLVGENEVDVLRSVLADVSSMRLVVASFYGLSEREG